MLGHGGEIYTHLLAKGVKLIDFSANINPLGLPQGVIQAIQGEAENFAKYPDPLCRALRAALAEHSGVEANRIVCGNGAADLIYRIVQYFKPRRALITAPSFSEYEKALTETGCSITTHTIGYPQFQIDETILSRISDDTDMLFLCNPNNPTGITIKRKLLEQIITRCGETKTILVIDECFNEFLDEPGAHTVKGFLNEAPYLIILRAFTKTYAMAGLRLGYLFCGSAETAGGIAGTGQCWAVSSAAQCAGIAALKERVYVEEARRLIQQERPLMKTALTGLGLEVLGGEANYLFCKIPEEGSFDKTTFFQTLLDRGFLIRNCGNYRGLDDSYFRIAVKKPEENKLFVDTLQEIRR
jgi:threonine-phosphate decarboxylase